MSMWKIFVAFLCVFMYYASPYRLLGMEFPEVLGALALLIQLAHCRKYHIPQSYGLLFVYLLVIPPVISLMMGMPGNYMISFFPKALILYTCYFIFLLPNVDYNSVLRFYRILVLIALVFFWIQEFSYSTFGYRPTLYAQFLEIRSDNFDAKGLSEITSVSNRSSSFFSEPAHFVEYIIPYFCIVLAKSFKERKVGLNIILLTATIIWVQSGSAYFVLAALIIYIFLKDKTIKISIKVISLLLFSIIVYIAFSFFRDNEIVSTILFRSTEFSPQVEQFGQHSGFIRIWRGYFIYDALPSINKILGVGIGSGDYVTSLMNVYDPIDGKGFFNGIQWILVFGGIVGTCLFARFLYKFIKKCNIAGKYVIVAMIALFFVENMMFTPKMFLYLLVAVAISNINPQLNINRLSLKTKKINDESINS